MSEIRKFQSKFESIKQGEDYITKIVEIFNKAIRDELAAAISYQAMAEKIVGTGNSKLKEELAEHGTDEYNHFNKFLAYAAKHGFLERLTIDIDHNVIVNAPSEVKSIIAFSQDLEVKAYEDYRTAAKFAFDNNDFETQKFLEEIAAEEEEHFDDVAIYTGQVRPLVSY